MSERSDALRTLIGSLVKYKVLNWSSSSEEKDTDRVAVYDMGAADVTSSLIEHSKVDGSGGKHMVLLDIDHPAWLVKSGTPGHYHLYIEVPGGIEWDKYKPLLEAAANAGVIERGFANASISRGHSDLRLPWKPKPVEGVSGNGWTS